MINNATQQYDRDTPNEPSDRLDAVEIQIDQLSIENRDLDIRLTKLEEVKK